MIYRFFCATRTSVLLLQWSFHLMICRSQCSKRANELVLGTRCREQWAGSGDEEERMWRLLECSFWKCQVDRDTLGNTHSETLKSQTLSCSLSRFLHFRTSFFFFFFIWSLFKPGDFPSCPVNKMISFIVKYSDQHYFLLETAQPQVHEDVQTRTHVP